MLLFRTASFALALTAGLLGGCATSRSELSIATPASATAPRLANPNAPTAVVRVVKDARMFEQKPSEPSTPSLGFEGSDKATFEIKQRAVGRKRNSFGMALGDVLLQQGQSVEGLVRDSITEALRESGYNVVAGGAVTTPSMEISADIKKFWSWVQPGFVAITVKSEIAVDLTVSSKTGVTPVSVSVEDPRQFVTDSAWLEAIQKALAAFRAQAVRVLPKGPQP